MKKMTQAEIAREETEKRTICEILLMIKESKSLDELEEKVKALLNK